MINEDVDPGKDNLEAPMPFCNRYQDLFKWFKDFVASLLVKGSTEEAVLEVT